MRRPSILSSAIFVIFAFSAIVSTDAFARQNKEDEPAKSETGVTPATTAVGTSAIGTSTSTKCPFTTQSKALQISEDGCGGTPAGMPQLPTLLQTYGSHRPQWNVAGVDYYVGAPTGTALKDPATAAPKGCSYKPSSNDLQCNGSNLIISGYDFSLHGGARVTITGSNNSVIGNNFALAPKCQDPLINFTINAGATLNISQNSFDGGGATCTNLVFGSIIFGSYGSGSTATVQYNYFYKTPQDVIDNGGPKSGSANLVMQYNLINIQGFSGHPDGVQFNGGNFSGSVINFNTYNSPFGNGTTAGTQPLHIEAQLTAAIANTTVAFNTVVTPGSCNAGKNFPTGCSVNYGIACKLDSGRNSNSGFTAYGNYIDSSGAIAALNNGYKCTGSTWGAPFPNIDLNTGSVVSP
jgi:hypothetical protein